MMNKFIVTTFFLLQTIQFVSANDEVGDIDKARVFPVQKNSISQHSNKNSNDSDESQMTSSSLMAADKKISRDTSLSINGNGGSTNRSAGGNAVLKKRFSFD